METVFCEGDRVQARVSVQGLQAGRLYTVTSIGKRPTPFGIFISYLLKPSDGGDQFPVCNGHLLLDLVAAA